MAAWNDTRIFRALRAIAVLLASLWITGGTAFFILRFSAAFYHANKSAIDGLLKRLL